MVSLYYYKSIMNRTIILIISCTLLCGANLIAQVNSDDYQLSVKKTKEQITIDGKLDEQTWLVAQKADDFIQNFPTDSLRATSQTEVSISFDDEYLYVGGKCYENSHKKHVIQSLRRDFDWPINENFGIYFDPYNDYTNGFTFGVTPAGVQREGLITNSRDVSSDWDNKWQSAVHDAGEYWSFEFKIPFKTIRYNPESRIWNMMFLRLDLKNNERSAWAPIPQGNRPSLAFAGRINFQEDLPKAGVNISFIPFLAGSVSKNHEDGEAVEYTSGAGFDAKIGLSSSLNLDLTVNPDFSQVEVDQQVTNLNRFELFFPERRQFFLENNDLFGSNGFRSSRPFFSRRIGITSNDVVLNGEEESLSGQVPIQYGVRLSGKIGQDWRVGLLNMMTKETEELALPQQVYTMATVQRQVFTSSNIGFMVVNKNSLGIDLSDSTKFLYNESLFKNEDPDDDQSEMYLNDYNTVYGVDFNFRSPNNKWNSNSFHHRSVSPNNRSGEFATGAFIGFTNRNVQTRLFAVAVTEDYNAEVGFIRRRDVKELGSSNDFFFYPKSNIINNHGPAFDLRYVTNMNNERTDYSVKLEYTVQFLNTMRIRVEAERRNEVLRRDFDPTRSDDGVELLEGQSFTWNTSAVTFNTDTRKRFSFEGGARIGGFYNGNRTNYNGLFTYRYQPYGGVGLRVDYNDIELPSPYNSAQFWLIGPRIDFTFTKELFLTTFVQYNEQADNINVNARFQWRYKPASDLFIVYTDNYLPGSFGIKNRALVLKLNYWLNI